MPDGLPLDLDAWLADPHASTTPRRFARWSERGTARVLFAHWVEPAGDGRSALVSEARVGAVDRSAGLRLRTLWAIVGPWERLIGGEALARAARLAQDGRPLP
jgi:hypothetical protein